MKKIIFISIAVLIFVFGHDVLISIYPKAKTNTGVVLDYDSFIQSYNAFNEYYYAKEMLNEGLFSLLFFIAFIYVKDRIFSSIAIFGFTVAFCSFLDKFWFKNYDYLISDFVVVVIGLILSIKVYKNGEIPSRDKRVNS